MAGIFDRVKLAADAIAGRVSAVARWDYRSGTKSGYMMDGSKFRGGMLYPSAFDFDHNALRDRSRVTYWETSQAAGILNSLVDSVVGTGLSVECSPLWSLIGDHGLDEKAQHKFARDIETRFDLYMRSHELDATGRLTGYEFQGFEQLNRFRDGEIVAILRYSGDAKRMSPLSVQFILPEQVVDPADASVLAAVKARGNRVINGIEVDDVGKEIAFHIADIDDRGNIVPTRTTRVPVSGPSGRRFVLHPIIADTLGAVRGTPLLGSVVHELQKITDGTVAELEAMVLNATLAVWIEPGQEHDSSNALTGIKKRGTTEAGAPAYDDKTGAVTFDRPGVIIQTLKRGEKVNSFDSKRPNINFPEFVRQILTPVAASKGCPIEVLEKKFGQNYSASRATLLLYWNTVNRWREANASQFTGQIFETWFAEEVTAGRIAATNFDTTPLIRAAWLNYNLVGDKMPSINPLDEARADAERIAQGAKTRERNAMEYNATDFSDNVKRLKIENDSLADAQEKIMKLQNGQTAPETADPEKTKNEENK